MYIDPNSPNSKNSLIFIMASLSPTVANSLDLELYRANAESDGVTTDYIIEHCVANMFRDLEAIGLIFKMDVSDLTDDPVRLSHFLILVEMLLPNGLYPKMKIDGRLRNLIRGILEGSVGDGGSVIQVYLSEIGGLDGGIPHQPILMDMIDQLYLSVSQTETFSEYLANLQDLLLQEQITLPTDAERHTQYQAKLLHIIGNMSDAVNLFDDDADYGEMTKIQNFIIRDFISPDNFVDYAYLLLEHPNTLPEELHAGFYSRWKQYRVSHRWNFDYYGVRNIKDIPRAFQMMIACFNYALSSNHNDYTVKNMGLRQMYPDPFVDEKISALFMLKD